MTVNKITEIYAFINDGGQQGESVVGVTMNINGRETFMPFVCADKAWMESLRPIADTIAKESGRTIKLIKFTNRKDLEIINP